MAWEGHSAQEMEKLGMTRERYDGCMFPGRSDQSKSRSGKRTTFIVNGASRRDRQALGRDGAETAALGCGCGSSRMEMKERPLSMGIRKIPGGYALKGHKRR